MTRKVVGYENKPYEDDRVIQIGALHVDDDRLPVCMTTNPDAIVGSAKDFERDEERGEVSMDIVFFNYVNNDLDHYTAHILVTPFEVKNIEEKHVVVDGRIREVMLTQKVNGVERHYGSEETNDG